MGKKQALAATIAAVVVILISGSVVLAGPPRQGPLPQPTPLQPGVVSSTTGLTGGANRPQSLEPVGSAGVSLPSASSLVPPERQTGVLGSPAGIGLPPNRQEGGDRGEVPPTGQMSYQGKLLNNGSPFTGDITITFRLYYTSTGDVAWWTETQDVHVEDGLFNVMLGAVNPLTRAAAFFKYQTWLGIQPAGAPGELTPRQPLGAVGYAMSLMPGAMVEDRNPPGSYSYSLWVSGNAHGGIYGSSEASSGVVGASSFTGTAGVLGQANGAGGVGVWGIGPGATFSDWPVAIGVRGSAQDWGVAGEGWNGVVGWGTEIAGSGVTGEGFLTSTAGVKGFAYGDYADGVAGFASGAHSRGVYGYVLDGSDYDNSAGVWGETGSSGGGIAVLGRLGGDTGIAVKGDTHYGHGMAVLGEAFNGIGVRGSSMYDNGVEGVTFRIDMSYGLYTQQNLYSLNFHSAGAVMQLAQNSGSVPLEPGDVVVFSGIGAPLENGLRVVQVARADAANSTAVAGVVSSGYNIAAATTQRPPDGSDLSDLEEITPAGPVPPGEYLLVVVQGPAQVKASAAGGAIQPGDLLVSAGQPGYAARTTEVELNGVRLALPGTVFGKALEALEAGEKTIYVFVTLH